LTVLIPYLSLIICLLVLEGFFSGSEIAIIACDKFKIKNKAAAGERGARMVEKMLEKPEWLLGTTLVGTHFAAVANTILVTFLLIDRFPNKGEFYAVLFLAPFILFGGEILPKTLSRQKADFLAPKVIFVLWLSTRLFFPVLWIITVFPQYFPGRFFKKADNDSAVLERDDLRFLLQIPQNGSDILVEERKMVDRLIELSGKKVHEVMIPLIDVAAVPETATWEEAVNLILKKGHSRLPVFRERIFNIIGLLHHFDLLLQSDRSKGLDAIVQPAFYVPETKQVYELLLHMKKSGNSMAIAMDEYGGATGIITLEDILEEIVGEIEDEYDSKRSLYQKLGPSTYLFDARIEIDHFSERFSFSLPEGDYETLGGLMMSKMGRIPQVGDIFRHKNLTFTVESATPRAVQQVRLDILKSHKVRGLARRHFLEKKEK